MSTTNKKFTEDEIKQLKSIRSEFTDISYKLGQVEIQKLGLEEEKKKLLTSFSTTIEKEKSLAKELINKYGKGEIDLDSGEFIPSA